MQRILSKRVLRDIRENLLRYLALFFLVALVMYMVVAIVGAAETICRGRRRADVSITERTDSLAFLFR